ncbi:23931_t:CDS:1, partial [Gigaspora rosea]
QKLAQAKEKIYPQMRHYPKELKKTDTTSSAEILISKIPSYIPPSTETPTSPS